MNERAEQTNDVLGKLTVLGTIVLPMNIVTGMWGMNTKVCLYNRLSKTREMFLTQVQIGAWTRWRGFDLVLGSHGRPICLWLVQLLHRQKSVRHCIMTLPSEQRVYGKGEYGGAPGIVLLQGPYCNLGIDPITFEAALSVGIAVLTNLVFVSILRAEVAQISLTGYCHTLLHACICMSRICRCYQV